MNIIDINCDMGENKGNDESVVKFISSSNIACGGHAGDSNTIRKSILLALENGVNAGAHPGYDDKGYFGRRETGQAPDEVLDIVLGQIHAFCTEAAKENTGVSHIKLHGALYNRAAIDYKLMLILASGVMNEFGNIPFFTLYGSESEKAISDAGGVYFSEGFADRAYDSTGKLISRSVDGAVLHDKSYIASRALDMARYGKIISFDGFELQALVDTICVHGDTPGAVSIAEAVNDILTSNEIIVGRRDAL